MKRVRKLLIMMMAAIVLALQGEAAAAKEPVVAEGLAKISVEGATDLPGNFFLSFAFSRNLIMLDGKGHILWYKHEE